MEGSKYDDISQEREQKRHQELQINLLAIKIICTECSQKSYQLDWRRN